MRNKHINSILNVYLFSFAQAAFLSLIGDDWAKAFKGEELAGICPSVCNRCGRKREEKRKKWEPIRLRRRRRREREGGISQQMLITRTALKTNRWGPNNGKP
jgi:hypothetical protein